MFDFGIVPTVWYFIKFYSIYGVNHKVKGDNQIKWNYLTCLYHIQDLDGYRQLYNVTR